MRAIWPAVVGFIEVLTRFVPNNGLEVRYLGNGSPLSWTVSSGGLLSVLLLVELSTSLQKGVNLGGTDLERVSQPPELVFTQAGGGRGDAKRSHHAIPGIGDRDGSG